MREMGVDPLLWRQDMRKALKELKQPATPITIHHFHNDHLGTPIALTDQTGNIAWAAKSDPWGIVQQEYNPHDIEQNIRLPGQYHDRETDLYYNYRRYYDPKIGAYINQDPIGLRGGINLTQYAAGSPLQKTDPLGLLATATQSGNIITINLDINLQGPYASPELAARWQQAISSAWNEQDWKVHNCSIKFNPTVSTGKNNAPNNITVGPPGTGKRSFVSNGNGGTWYADDEPYVAGHEAGHLMGLGDHYREYRDANNAVRTTPENSSWENDIMSEYNGKASQRDVNSILLRLGKFSCRC